MTTGGRAVRVRISGRVQGVWFRAWTVSMAKDFGLDGWVRNRSDGSVEAVFAGPGPQVDKMLAHFRDGPPAARVDALESDEIEPATYEGTGFRQLPTE
jgi:acylphosphatase